MIPRHLTSYHFLSIDFAAVIFLKNRLVSQNSIPLRRIVKRGTKSNPIHNLKTKMWFKDIEISHNFVHSCWHLDVSYVYVQTAVGDRAFARSLCCCCSKP